MIRRSIFLALALAVLSWQAQAGPREDMLAEVDKQIEGTTDAKKLKALRQLRAHIESLDPLPAPRPRTARAAASALLGGVQMAQSITLIEGGFLGVQPDGTSVCPGGSVFFPGQAVRLTGSGFDGNASIDILFGENEADPTLLTTANANGAGALDAVVSLPAAAATNALGQLEARGATDVGSTLVLVALFQVSSASPGDTDGDGVPNVCDNCPDASNSGQENGDLDTLGNACDACPLDPDNDRDGDGVCADADQCPFDAANDLDGDALCAGEDNCPVVANPSQLDSDVNGVGDACQSNITCADGIDNDRDSFTDFPADTGCEDATDTTETDPARQCDDGIDNDADALDDYRPTGAGDPGCGADTTLSEDPECDDDQDNDGDGTVDWDGDFGMFAPDPNCGGVGSTVTELPEPGAGWGVVAGTLCLAALERRRGAVGKTKPRGQPGRS